MVRGVCMAVGHTYKCKETGAKPREPESQEQTMSQETQVRTPLFGDYVAPVLHELVVALPILASGFCFQV